MTTTCKSPVCDAPVKALGLCSAHYWRHCQGDARTDEPVLRLNRESVLGIPAYVAALIDARGPCWLWCGTIAQHGYGRVGVSGESHYIHRFVYEALVGPVPSDLVLDHLCRVRCCCNPDHLEPVTPLENFRRGIDSNACQRPIIDGVTYCRNGLHAIRSEWDLNPGRNGRKPQCKECQRAAQRRYKERHRLDARTARR